MTKTKKAVEQVKPKKVVPAIEKKVEQKPIIAPITSGKEKAASPEPIEISKQNIPEIPEKVGQEPEKAILIGVEKQPIPVQQKAIEQVEATPLIGTVILSEAEEKKTIAKIAQLYTTYWSIMPNTIEEKLAKIIDALHGLDIPTAAYPDYLALISYIDNGKAYLEDIEEIKASLMKHFMNIQQLDP